MSEPLDHITIIIHERHLYVDLPSETICIEDQELVQQLLTIFGKKALEDTHYDKSLISATTISVILEASRIKPILTPYRAFDFPYVGQRIPLEGINPTLPDKTISELLCERRSYRKLGEIDFSSFSNILYHGARVRDIWIAPDNYKATSRASPSAGGRHPIDLLCVVNGIVGLNEGIYVFDPFLCELIEIANSEKAREELTIEAFTRLGEEAIPPVVVFFIAQVHKTFTRYPGGITFIYRDCGAMITTISLVATSLDLYSCAIGTSGSLIINKLLDIPFPDLVEVGGIALGRRNHK